MGRLSITSFYVVSFVLLSFFKGKIKQANILDLLLWFSSLLTTFHEININVKILKSVQNVCSITIYDSDV